MSDVAYQEFPKCLTHPELPAVIVNSAAEEERRLAEGYAEPGRSDAHAFEWARSGAPAAYKPQEFPKWVNGVLVADAKQERAALAGKLKPVDPYPMTITIGNGQQIIVKDRAEHERLVSGPLDDQPSPRPEMPTTAEWSEFKAAQAAGELPLKGQAA